MADRVNRLNRAFTVIFTEAMQSVKPLKDIEKLKANIAISEDDEPYGIRIKKWQSAFAFTENLRIYINDLSNIIVLAGGPNSSDGPNKCTQESVKKIKTFMEGNDKRKSFDKYMELCKPKEETISEGKLKIWKNAFTFPIKLNGFIGKLEEQTKEGKEITGEKFIEKLDEFIESLKIEKEEFIVREDEFLIKETTNIGEQEYESDPEIIELVVDEKMAEITERISKTADSDIKKRFEDNKENFEKVMRDAQKNKLEIKAEKKILEKKYDKASTKNSAYNLDKAIESGVGKLKKYPKWMNRIAIAGIGGIVILMILSITCPIGCTSTGFVDETGILGKISDAASSVTILENKTVFGPNENLESMELTTTTDTSATPEIQNPYRDILESNIMYLLIITVIAPVVTKTLKEKYDINIEEKQISMIIQDGIKSTSMYTKEADKLRNSEGKIPRKYQEVLRAKAFKSIKQNYEPKKYKELISSVGAQVFDKAIENAVESGKLEKFPLEKKQVEELIKQSIDAAPGIIEWQKLDDQAKTTFIDGNIRKILQNTGINGWSYKALENIFDAETSKRLVNAALLQKDNLLAKLDDQDPYLRYTSTVADAILERNTSKNNGKKE